MIRGLQIAAVGLADGFFELICLRKVTEDSTAIFELVVVVDCLEASIDKEAELDDDFSIFRIHGWEGESRRK